MLDFLRQQGIGEDLIVRIEQFRKDNPIAAGDETRIPCPKFKYYGREIRELPKRGGGRSVHLVALKCILPLQALKHRKKAVQ